jgi:hypothetical protein
MKSVCASPRSLGVGLFLLAYTLPPALGGNDGDDYDGDDYGPSQGCVCYPLTANPAAALS